MKFKIERKLLWITYEKLRTVNKNTNVKPKNK